MVEAPLYNESFDYVALFFNLDSIENKDLINKVIVLVSELKWEADAVNYLQYSVIDLVNENSKVTEECLSHHDLHLVENFWRFYFAGPVTLDVTPNEFDFLETENQKIFGVMKSEWERASKIPK